VARLLKVRHSGLPKIDRQFTFAMAAATSSAGPSYSALRRETRNPSAQRHRDQIKPPQNGHRPYGSSAPLSATLVPASLTWLFSRLLGVAGLPCRSPLQDSTLWGSLIFWTFGCDYTETGGFSPS